MTDNFVELTSVPILTRRSGQDGFSQIRDGKGQYIKVQDYHTFKNPLATYLTAETVLSSCIQDGKNSPTLSKVNQDTGEALRVLMDEVIKSTNFENNSSTAVLRAFNQTALFPKEPFSLRFPVADSESVMDKICKSPIMQKVRKAGQAL